MQGFGQLNLEYGSLVPQMVLRGFYFEKINIDWPKDCNKSDKFDLKFLILLSKRINHENGWEEFYIKCQHSFSPIFRFQMSQVGKAKLPLQKILKILPPEANTEKVKDIYISSSNETKPMVLRKFFFKVIKEERDEIKQRILVLEAIKDKPDDLFKNFLELSVAIDSDNQAWSKKIVKKIINMGPTEYLFSRTIEDPDSYNQVKEGLKKLLRKIRSNLKDEMLGKMLINHLANISSSKEIKDELSAWSADWTLSDIRVMLDSPTYGIPFVGFWFLEMFSATYEAEVMRFLQDTLDKETAKKYGKYFPWIFKFYLPKNSEPDVAAMAVDMWKSGSSYQRSLVLDFLEKPEIKTILVKELPELSKPIFQLRRTFFMNMLRNGENLNFSVYQMLKLGDRSEDLLWWVTFFEK